MPGRLPDVMWNGFENGFTREFVKVLHEGVSVNQKIWIPPNGEFNEETDVFTEKVNHIQVRILYNGKMNFFKKGRQWEERKQEGCGCTGGSSKVKEIEKILIYLHGGGFVVWTSRTAQAWTTRWCNKLDVPIFCIDYRQPPGYHYPQPVYDCFVGYQFIMHHISNFMNVTPR